MAVTMKDVAKAAGVSPATVSFVLNETTGQSLRADTIERVRQAAASLGYTPNRIARALREGSSRLVLLRAGQLRGSGLSSLISGLQDELRKYGHTLIVTYADSGDDDLLTALSPRRVLDLNQPRQPGFTTAGDGGWEAQMARHTATQIEYLLAKGHRNIAFACPTGGLLVEMRTTHVKQFAELAGLPSPALLVLPDDQGSALSVVAGTRRRHPEVTAIATFSDHEAIRLLAILNTLRVRVPDDLAVIGFDEDEVGALWTPALTTVKIDAESYGRRMARVALGLADEPWQRQPSTVIVRQSA